MKTHGEMACVTVDPAYDYTWVLAVVCQLHFEGKLTSEERDNFLRDIMENS